MRRVVWLLMVGMLALPALAQEVRWVDATVELTYTDRAGTPIPGKDGKPQVYVANLSLPEGLPRVRGLLLGGSRNAEVRAALAEKGMGTLSFSKHPDGLFSYASNDSGWRLEHDLAMIAEKVGRPELAFVPYVTIGYSTAGIWCRNIAYWDPDRVIGVLHMKSGNLQAHIEDMRASLAGVPFLAVNGECEQYGPDGGDLGAGHRAIYSLNPDNKRLDNQTQWVMIRTQLLERRRRNAQNLMGLVVQHTSGNSDDHTSWDAPLSAVLAQFIRSAADARIPKDPPAGTPVQCLPVQAEQGWLYDADIKAPRYPAAPYAEYTGDRTQAFWCLDKAMAEAIAAYHTHKPWAFPDPTAGQPAEQRFSIADPILRDLVDIRKPLQMVWGGGDSSWREDYWSRAFGAELTSAEGGRLTLASDINVNGLLLGANHTIATGRHTLFCNWHGELRDGGTLAVTLAPDDKGDKAVRLRGAGNLDLAGTLVITAEGELPEGDYRLIRCAGKLGGAFTRIVPPAGYTATMKGGVVTLKKG